MKCTFLSCIIQLQQADRAAASTFFHILRPGTYVPGLLPFMGKFPGQSEIKLQHGEITYETWKIYQATAEFLPGEQRGLYRLFSPPSAGPSYTDPLYVHEKLPERHALCAFPDPVPGPRVSAG